MPFPLDPNAPGGPERSEYVRRSYADGADVTVRLAESVPALDEPAVVAELDGEPVAALGLRDGDVVADPVYATSDLMALLHLRRLEARIIMSVFGA
jgi:hypothetical protein